MENRIKVRFTYGDSFCTYWVNNTSLLKSAGWISGYDSPTSTNPKALINLNNVVVIEYV